MTYKLDSKEIAKAVVAYLHRKKVEGSDYPYFKAVFSISPEGEVFVEVSFCEVKPRSDIG